MSRVAQVLILHLKLNNEVPQLRAPDLQVLGDVQRPIHCESYLLDVVDLILVEEGKGTVLVLRLELIARHSLPDAPKHSREEQALECPGSKAQVKG
jgi:hypothetical protein